MSDGSNNPEDPQGQGVGTPAPNADASLPTGSPGGSVQGSDGSADSPQDQGQAPAPQPRVDWRDRRIGEQQARIRELRAQLEQYQNPQHSQSNSQPQQAYSGNGQAQLQQPYMPGAMPDPALIERQIQERAQQLAAQQEFNRRCNDAAEIGRRQFTDFDSRVSKLVGLVDQNDPAALTSYNNFLNAALETGDPAKLIHALGGDLDEASRVLTSRG